MIHDLIQSAYPGAMPGIDYELRDDSNGIGPYISAWHIAGPIPAGVPSMESPTTRWVTLSLERMAQGARLIDGLATNARLRPAVEAAIAATEPGALVPGTSWTREQAADVLAVWDALASFLQAPVSEGGPTPVEVISRYA